MSCYVLHAYNCVKVLLPWMLTFPIAWCDVLAIIHFICDDIVRAANYVEVIDALNVVRLNLLECDYVIYLDISSVTTI